MTGFERVMVACMGLIMQALALAIVPHGEQAIWDMAARLNKMSDTLRKL